MTKFAFQIFPHVNGTALIVLFVALAVNPLLETLQMNMSDGSCAMAWGNKRILFIFLSVQTDSANEVASFRSIERLVHFNA